MWYMQKEKISKTCMGKKLTTILKYPKLSNYIPSVYVTDFSLLRINVSLYIIMSAYNLINNTYSSTFLFYFVIIFIIFFSILLLTFLYLINIFIPWVDFPFGIKPINIQISIYINQIINVS